MPELMGMKHILALNDEAHHCYREKPPDPDDEELKGDERKEAEKNNEAARLWISGLEAVNRTLGARARPRPLGDAVLPARLRLRRRHALPLDDERLLADGRDRVRHRQAAARAGRREHPRRRDADLPQPLGAHPQGHAEEGARHRRRARSAEAAEEAADRARGALRALREDVRAVAGARHLRSALLHRRLPEHGHLEAGLRLHLRLPPQARGRHRDALEHGRLALFRNFDETTGNPLAAPEHAADRFRGARVRRSARRQVPRDGGGRDRALPPRHRRAHRRRARRREHHRPGPAARGDEHGRQEGPARRRHPLRRVGLDAHRRLGRQQRHPHPRHPRVRHAAPLRTGDRPRASAPVLRAQRRRPVRRRVRRHLRRAVRLHRQAGCRAAAARRERPCRSRRFGRTGTTWRFVSRASRATASSCRPSGSRPTFNARLGVGADAGSRRSDEDAQPGHHRRNART